jgi:hypothetical protein
VAGIVPVGILSPGKTREAQMGKYVNRITHKGKEMLFVNTGGVNEKEAIEAWEEMRQAIPKNPDIHLVLVDGRNVAITPAIVRKAREARSGEAHADSQVVFVGLTPIQRTTAELVARGMRLNVHFCKTLDEGKEWLVRESEKRREA